MVSPWNIMADLDPSRSRNNWAPYEPSVSVHCRQNPYLPMYSAFGGAFVGAVSSFFPNYIIASLKTAKTDVPQPFSYMRKLRQLSSLPNTGNYIQQMERVAEAFNANQITSYIIRFKCPRTDSHFQKQPRSTWHARSRHPSEGCRVLSTCRAVVQDVKPGGLLNARPPAPVEAFQEALRITKRARQLGGEILATIEDRYQIPNSSVGAPRSWLEE